MQEIQYKIFQKLKAAGILEEKAFTLAAEIIQIFAAGNEAQVDEEKPAQEKKDKNTGDDNHEKEGRKFGNVRPVRK